jgi:hypothetical protein
VEEDLPTNRPEQPGGVQPDPVVFERYLSRDVHSAPTPIYSDLHALWAFFCEPWTEFCLSIQNYPLSAPSAEPLAWRPLLYDVFGNPFRPVTFDPEWRTDTAVALARQMYESREFSAMPILADALQDAGCDNTDILAHCRDEGATHVRGCWVVDLVLGLA